VYVLRDYRHEPWFYVISILCYNSSFKEHDYVYGAALGVIILVIMAAVSVVYIRQLIKISEDQ
jgi:ABC-type sugar transport system permease subunit